MHERGKQHANGRDERHAAEQGIERGEQFPGRVLDGIDWPHAGEDHCRVEQGDKIR